MSTRHPLFPHPTRLKRGIWISVVCWLLFAGLAVSVTGGGALVDLDEDLLGTLRAPRESVVEGVFLAITWCGSRGVWLVSLSTAAILIGRRRWTLLFIGLATVGGGELLQLGLKHGFARERPVIADPVVTEPTFSFPSGHAMMSLLAYGLLVALVAPRLPDRRARIGVIVGVALFVGLIGFSRLVLAIHYTSDVVGGFVAGGAWLAAWLTVLETVRQRRGENGYT
jgi:undecaprenyl-diphosphatase